MPKVNKLYKRINNTWTEIVNFSNFAELNATNTFTGASNDFENSISIGDLDNSIKSVIGDTKVNEYYLYLGSTGFYINDSYAGSVFSFLFPKVIDDDPEGGGTWTLATTDDVEAAKIPILDLR